MIRAILDYCQEADNRIIEVFTSTKNSPPQALALFSHVLNAQHIWASRMLNRKSKFSFFQVHLLDDFGGVHEQNFVLFREVLDQISLNQKVNYIDSEGLNGTSAVRDILFHVFNHSTHHRGQIVMLFRDNGIEPPVTDYIYLKTS
ncbi:putative damage-inducible protein DinB [Pedobacter sp. UYEF25]